MLDEVITKVCSKCLTEKNFTEFYKNKSAKSGLKNICIDCNYEKDKKYRFENKEKIADRHKRYMAKNKKKIAEYHKIYKADNKERIAEHNKRYEVKNKEKIAERKKRYAVKNKEKINELNKKYSKNSALELKNYYVRSLITKSNQTLKQAPIPQSLINLKREEIKIKRLIKEMTT